MDPQISGLPVSQSCVHEPDSGCQRSSFKSSGALACETLREKIARAGKINLNYPWLAHFHSFSRDAKRRTREKVWRFEHSWRAGGFCRQHWFKTRTHGAANGHVPKFLPFYELASNYRLSCSLQLHRLLRETRNRQCLAREVLRLVVLHNLEKSSSLLQT